MEISREMMGIVCDAITTGIEEFLLDKYPSLDDQEALKMYAGSYGKTAGQWRGI